MSASHLTQGHHVYTMCPDIIFQILLSCSRPMMSHHVTCYVTAMSHASSSSIKEKEIQKKRNIKLRKIDKRKRKILVSRAFHNKYHDKQRYSLSAKAKITLELHLHVLDNIPILFQCLLYIFL